jgi:hypothetical protein
MKPTTSDRTVIVFDSSYVEVVREDFETTKALPPLPPPIYRGHSRKMLSLAIAPAVAVEVDAFLNRILRESALRRGSAEYTGKHTGKTFSQPLSLQYFDVLISRILR